MTRFFAPLVALVILLAAGFLHGSLTGRWVDRGNEADALNRLQRIPSEFGEWKGVEQELKLDELAGAGIRGGFTRIFTNSRTGDRVTMMLLYGKATQLSVHTPDVCYPAAGYAQVGGLTRILVSPEGQSNPSHFFVNSFRHKDRPTGDELTVHYAWGVDGFWQAPEKDARLTFAWYPGIYKMYIVRSLSKPNEAVDSGPSVEFLEQAVPVLNTALFSK